jgi:CRP-like cAMP-binding protein
MSRTNGRGEYMTASFRPDEQTLIHILSDYFSKLPFFNRINLEEIKVISKHIAIETVNRGELLFRESERGNYIGFIVNGRLEVRVRKGTSGSEVVLAELEQGQTIGEMAIIEDLPRFASVRALEDCRLFILSKSAFDLIIEKHPYIGIKILKGVSSMMSGYLRKTSIRLAEYL